jgi:CheY-like chemotaxis protein
MNFNKYKNLLFQKIKDQISLWFESDHQPLIPNIEVYHFLHSIKGTSGTLQLGGLHQLSGILMDQIEESNEKQWKKETWFKNGKAAIQYLKMEVPDAIVLDILLEDSEIDGWEIMKELKQNDRLKEIPIIISSALDEREKGLSSGAMNYLGKPYKPSDLSKTIMQTLLKKGHKGQILIPDQN